MIEGIDGIETARLIRQKNKKVALIYVSNYSEQMAASFAVHPFSFLEKPIQNSKIREVLAEYLQYYGTEEKNYISFPMHHGNVVIEPQKILYFEYEGNRKVKLVSTETVYHIIGSMSELENQLQQYHFIMPHKSFLVNVACINSFYNDIILSNGMKIPIAKNRRKQVHEKISDYLHHHLQK